MQTQFSVVVPAAGVGKRMQAQRPKQYLEIDGKSILQTTLEKLIAHPQIHHIYLVLHPDDQYFGGCPLNAEPWLTCVMGGEERVDSVLNGLRLVKEEWVLVHDAARPCVMHDDISRLLALAKDTDGGILAHRVRDTMKVSTNNQCVQNTANRDQLWHALTPQFFKTDLLIRAIESAQMAGHPITDEASAMEYTGSPVHLIAGRPSNIKITTQDDLAIAQYYLTQQRELDL